MSDFRNKTISGMSWTIFSRIGRMSLRFVIGVMLARLLSPREFGLLAMVTVITSFASIFAELGFSAALVQKREVHQEQLSSVFWLNLGAGLTLTLIFVAGSPLIAWFYSEPLLQPMTMVLATNFFINSLNIVQNTLFTKALDFRTLSIVEIVSVAIAGATAICMAVVGLGVWSLAVQSVVNSLTTAVLLWSLSSWRPRLVFRWSAIRPLLGFSLNLFGSKILNYWVRNLDYLLIGKVLGTNPLGIYKKSYDLMLFPLTNITRVISRVMFPSFSLIQDDRKRVARLFLRVTRVIALITFPMMLGLFVVVQPFVLVVFGPKWAGMIPVLRILSLVGLTQSIGALVGNLYLSQGRADLQFRVGLIVKAGVILGIIAGLQWGIVGVAVGFAITTWIGSYPSFYFAGRLVGLTYWDVLKNLSGVFGCSLAMAILVWVVGRLLPPDWPMWAALALQVSVGAIAYALMIHMFRVKAYLEVRELAWERAGPALQRIKSLRKAP